MLVNTPKAVEMDRGKPFGEKEVDILLGFFSEDGIQERLRTNQRSHGAVWQHLADRMTSAGFPRSAAQVKDKLANLRRRYLALKRSLKTGDPPPDWVHWAPLHKLYASVPAGHPEVVMDSLVSLSTRCMDGLVEGCNGDNGTTPSPRRVKGSELVGRLLQETRPKEMDGVYHFCMALADLLRRRSPDEQLELQIKILEVMRK